MAATSSTSDRHRITSKMQHLRCLKDMCRHSQRILDAWICQHCAQKGPSPWTCLTACHACHAVVLSSNVCFHMYHVPSPMNRQGTSKDPDLPTCWISSNLPGVQIHIHGDVHPLQDAVDRQGYLGTEISGLKNAMCYRLTEEIGPVIGLRTHRKPKLCL